MQWIVPLAQLRSELTALPSSSGIYDFDIASAVTVEVPRTRGKPALPEMTGTEAGHYRAPTRGAPTDPH